MEEMIIEIGDILARNRHSRSGALVELSNKKREGKLDSEDMLFLITNHLNPRRTKARGDTVGLHLQLARTKFADCSVPDREIRGTPPQRHSWSVADRRREPIRRGSPEWAALMAKRRAIRNKNEHDDDVEAAPVAPVKNTHPPVVEAAPMQDSAPVRVVESSLEQALPVQNFALNESNDPCFEIAFPEGALSLEELFYAFNLEASHIPEPASIEKSAHVAGNVPPAGVSSSLTQYSEEDDDQDNAFDPATNLVFKPGTRWGLNERGRSKQQGLAARARCASRQPSSLRLS
ncbi:hypothetical protein N0V82_005991 [Gnomoniopsis sp. IMI 355080]|nr:hypothetical protein N0V82_005991 [Gnomoniopsis sp. IMI 355080]